MGTRQIYVDGTDRAYSVLFPDNVGVVESADGGVEIGQIIIDDPDGTYDGLPLNAAYIEETLAAPTRLWTGYILNQTESRGPYRSGPSRIVTCQTMDINRNLYIRPVLSKNGYRPAETDLDRLTWLLGNPAVDGLVYSGAYTNLTDNPINLGDADYRDQRPGDILADFTPVAGKRAFVFWNSLTSKPELFYDLVDAAIFDAPAAITNNLSDLTTGIYAPDPGAEWDRSGEEIASGILLVYKGTGRVVSYNTTTKSTYGEFVYVYTSDRIGELATAQSIADAYVATHNVPKDTLTFTVQLPRANVNDIAAGQRMQVKFTHFTGLTAWTWVRVTKREVHLHPSGDYLVTIEATNHVNRAIGSGRGGGTNFPPPPAAAPSIVQTKTADTSSGNITLDTTPTEGNLLVYYLSRRSGDPGAPTSGSWTQHPHGAITPGSDGGRMGYRTVTGSDTTTINVVSGASGGKCTIWEVAGTATSHDSSSYADVDTGTKPATVDAGSMTPTSGEAALLFRGITVHCSDWGGNGDFTIADPSTWTRDGKHEVVRPSDSVEPDTANDSHPIHWAGHLSVSSTSGSYAQTQTITGGGNNFGGWGGLQLAFLSAGGGSQPAPGTPIPWAVVTVTPGSTTSTGTTAWPYAATTLEVMVDGVIINHASYTETDPTTGDFTLSWVVDPDNVVQVRYVSA